MRKKLAFLAAMAICMSSVPMTFAPYAATVSAAESAFNESEYFVVVGTYNSRDGENYTQLRYVNGTSGEKVAWKNAPEDLTYGDVLVAEGKFKLNNVREYSDEPVYAMASVNYLNDDAVLRKVGHCTELMERKKLTVTSTMYDGSGHFSIYLEDENGKEYYYGLSTVGSSLGVNLAYDAEYGDNVTFMFCNGNISIPLEVAKPLVPSWVPQSLAEAIDFYNEYGATHIGQTDSGSDVVCLVLPETVYDSEQYAIKSDANALVNELYHEIYKNPITQINYEVAVYSDDCKSPSSFNVNFSCDDNIKWTYAFQGDGSGNLNETDLYSWVPDCITEYLAFEKENGKISVQNGYVAFCETSIPGAGYSWTYNQSGDGELAKIINVRCTEHEEVYAVGGASRNFCLLKPEKDGKVNLNLVLERSFQQNSAMETIDKTYLISENCTKIEEVSNSLNLPELKQGEARVIITDYDTGELIPDEVFSSMEYFMMGTNIGHKEPSVPGGWKLTGPMYDIDSNPYYCDLAKFMNADLFEVNLTSAPEGYSLPDDYKVITKNDNGSLEIEFRLKKNPEIIKTGKVEGCSESNLTYTLDSEGTLTISGEGEIPCHVGFSDNSIKKIVIEDGVTGIGMESFFCKNLETIRLPENGCYIDSYAFSGGEKLKEIYIPDTEAGGISGTAFGMRDSSFTVIGYDDTYAQLYAEMAGFTFKSLGKPERKILFSDSLGGDVKYDFYNTLEAVISGKGKMNDYNYQTTPFSYSAVKSVTVEEGVTNIPEGFFNKCSILTQITLPDSLTSIGGAAFYECTALTEITIPKNVTSIGEEVFRGAENFKTIKGYKGSYAETYAKENGFTFVAIDTVKGDANGDGTFNIADVVSLNKWLLDSSEVTLENWKAADLNGDNKLNSADLVMMRRKLLNNASDVKQKITDSDIIELSKKGYDLTWKDLEKFQHGDDTGSGVNVYEYEIEYMSDRFSFIVSGIDNEIMSARLSVVNGRESVDIREGDVSMFFAEHNPPA